MMTQEQAREKLGPLNLSRVAEETGINRQTLYRFNWGGKISADNLERLSAWLERYGK